jgi:arginase
MEIDIYDPDLDPDGRYAEQLIAMIERAFKRAGVFAKAPPVTK